MDFEDHERLTVVLSKEKEKKKEFIYGSKLLVCDLLLLMIVI